MTKTKKETKSDELKQYVFYLEWELDKWRNGRTQLIWAKDRDDAERKMQSWRILGYIPRYMHTMDEFRERCKDQNNELNAKTSKQEHVAVEVENV